MSDHVDWMYANGATDEEVEEWVRDQSQTAPYDYEYFEEKESSAETELESENIYE